MSLTNELLKSLEANWKDFGSFARDLIVDNNVPFDNHEIDIVLNAVIKSINSHINEANTIYDGLLDLHRILPRCSKDVLSKYGSLWISKAIHILANVHSTMEELALACRVLGCLVERCKEIPELHKQISTQNIKQLINIFNISQTSRKCDATYYLIAVLLYHYPEVCERFQGLIKKMVLQQIDSVEENLINAGAKCYVLLAKATERLFKPPPAKAIYTSWTYNEALLCNNLHVIMDELFSELIELDTIDIWDQLELPSISEGNIIEYYEMHKQRFLNLCTYLSLMLRGYEAKNSVVPRDILGVLCRGLAITPLNVKSKEPSFKEQVLCVILPKLHCSLLTVLDAFINGFAQELISFGGTILQLFQQTLEWTCTVLENQSTFNNNKLFKSVRMYVYKCLSSWLMNTGSLSGIQTIANECLPLILKDVIPERDRILLTIQRPQCLSKRAMKRFKDNQYGNSSVLNNREALTKSTCLDADLCREALIVLQNMFFSGSILLKQSFYKNVQNAVIPLLYHVYLNSLDQSFYKNHKCRLELFKVLKALQMNSHVVLAPPTQYCLEISYMAARDVDLNIVQEAKLMSAELEKIIHPSAPTLQLPRQQEPDEFVFEAQIEETAVTTTTLTTTTPTTTTPTTTTPTTTTLTTTTPTTSTTFIKDKRSVDQALSQDADALTSTCKRLKIISQECTKVHDSRNGIESIEMHDSMDLDKTKTNENLCENISHESENIFEEKNEVHFNKEKNSSNIEKIINIKARIEPIIEMENEPQVTENQQQHEKFKDLMPCGDQRDKAVKKNLEITEAIQNNVPQDTWREQEELDTDVKESLNLFCDEVKSNY